MAAQFTFDGLAELRAALRTLPADLTSDASSIVEGSAHQAEAAIERAYPVRTGNLRDAVSVSVRRGSTSVAAVVKNTAKHAAIFENGTQARHTAIGANRGSMPPGHVFVPAIIRARRAMYERLRDLLVKHGLLVSGHA